MVLSFSSQVRGISTTLELGRDLLNSIPGENLNGTLNRSMKETLVPLSLLRLRVLLGLKESPLLLLDILAPLEAEWLQNGLNLCRPWRRKAGIHQWRAVHHLNQLSRSELDLSVDY